MNALARSEMMKTLLEDGFLFDLWSVRTEEDEKRGLTIVFRKTIPEDVSILPKTDYKIFKVVYVYHGGGSLEAEVHIPNEKVKEYVQSLIFDEKPVNGQRKHPRDYPMDETGWRS